MHRGGDERSSHLGGRSSVTIEATDLTARPPVLFSQENTQKGHVCPHTGIHELTYRCSVCNGQKLETTGMSTSGTDTQTVVYAHDGKRHGNEERTSCCRTQRHGGTSRTSRRPKSAEADESTLRVYLQDTRQTGRSDLW